MNNEETEFSNVNGGLLTWPSVGFLLMLWVIV